MPTLAKDSDAESVSCVGVRAAPKLNTPPPRQATSTGGANTVPKLNTPPRHATSTSGANNNQSPQPRSTKNSLKSTGHTDSELTPQSQTSRRARQCNKKTINYDDYGKTRRSKSARAGESPPKHRSDRLDVINRVGDMDEDSKAGNDGKGEDLDVEDLTIDAELREQEKDLIAEKKCEDHIAKVTVEREEESTADEEHDGRAHLSHNNSGKGNASGETTTVRDDDFQNRFTSGGTSTSASRGRAQSGGCKRRERQANVDTQGYPHNAKRE